ncbi:Uma2 family endonuclease [Dethiobacter alkaliphilus]|uniref:Uma2 family endonuclease n=1 Tax=Dethiobacter alkaliphilus TaxID=427926 RepID=UPI00222784CD|nr:Uma2 family endonuclease [Dethiobacter alkaliphilus]MCW3490696.1 Uma2 family endonuclease [Dethiobacter alkaliphilus]
MDKGKDLVTAQFLADTLDLSVETIWRYTRTDRIPYVKLGERQYRYNLDEVVRALSGVVKENNQDYNTEDKTYTYQDYLTLPDEPGFRYEILEGQLVKEPSPNLLHQRISRELEFLLISYFRQVDPKGEVFDAPLDVTFQDITVVQPDILYVAGSQLDVMKKTRIDGAPTLTVEIISDSSLQKDRVKKLQIYQKAGVQHYWLVNPRDKTFECFTLKDGLYSLIAVGTDDDVLEHPDFPGLPISLAQLWYDPTGP